MILVADTTGDAVGQVVEATDSLVVARDGLLHIVDLVVAVVRLSSHEHLQVHEVPADFFLCLLLMSVLFLIAVW